MESLTTLPFFALLAVTGAQLTTAFIASKLKIIPKFKNFFTSFSVGALLGNAFMHILPNAFMFNPEPLFISSMMLLGVLLNFFIEKGITVYKYYTFKGTQNIKNFRINHLIIDLMHSATIGATIIAAYQQSSQLGISTSIALGLIGIAQILSTMNIMLHHGASKKQIIKDTIITSFATIISGFSIHHYNVSIQKIDHILLPIGAGIFIYVALAKLIPELQEDTRLIPSIIQACIILTGIYIIYALPKVI